MYFVIRNSGGDTTVTALTKDELVKRLAENYWGEVEFHDKVPDNRDTNYWGDSILIIKGDIIMPQPVQTVTEYRV